MACGAALALMVPPFWFLLMGAAFRESPDGEGFLEAVLVGAVPATAVGASLALLARLVQAGKMWSYKLLVALLAGSLIYLLPRAIVESPYWCIPATPATILVLLLTMQFPQYRRYCRGRAARNG